MTARERSSPGAILVKVVSGGWQLARVAPCNALRIDHVSGELVDAPAHARYRVTA